MSRIHGSGLGRAGSHLEDFGNSAIIWRRFLILNSFFPSVFSGFLKRLVSSKFFVDLTAYLRLLSPSMSANLRDKVEAVGESMLCTTQIGL